MTSSPLDKLDKWASWILDRRFGGDRDERLRTVERLAAVRERVLDNALIKAGDTVLDVGCGDGLIGFGALDRVGERGTVIFSDISQDLLNQAQVAADALGVTKRSYFHLAPAENLAGIDDGSVDVVTTRSVLAYVADQERAFAEFARVLRAGGRISLYEPINRLCYPEPDHLFGGYDVTAVADLARKLNAVYHRRQPPDSDPMFTFDERDLLRFAESAGFTERHLELRVDVTPQTPQAWETFVRVAPNPLAPTLAEAMVEALNEEEQMRFEGHLRPLVEAGTGTFSVAVGYLWGIKR